MVGVKSYRAVKQLKDLMEKRPDITFFMFELINTPLNGFKRFNYHKNIVSDDIINSLIDLNAVEISAWILDEPNELDEYFIYIYNYIDKDISASVIQQAWRRYHLRTSRVRNDLVIHGLAIYWGHPSRLTFNID